MIRMKCFHCVETGSGKRWNSGAKTMLSGMSDRRDPASVVNDLDDRFRGWAFTSNEAWQSAPEPAIEGLLRACHVSRLDHRAPLAAAQSIGRSRRLCSSIGSTSIGTPWAARRDAIPRSGRRVPRAA